MYINMYIYNIYMHVCIIYHIYIYSAWGIIPRLTSDLHTEAHTYTTPSLKNWTLLCVPRQGYKNINLHFSTLSQTSPAEP